METIVLGMGDLAATCRPDAGLKVHALGSCVAVVILDPAIRGVGMDHVAMPESRIAPEQARGKPGYFADTGIPALLDALKTCGSRARGPDLIVKLVGGARVLDSQEVFNIGKRNLLQIKKTLWQYGMGAVAEDVGGSTIRNVTVDAMRGRVRISSPGRGDWEI